MPGIVFSVLNKLFYMAVEGGSPPLSVCGVVLMQILKVKRNDAGQRLDKFLSKAVKGLPMSLMYKFIRTKKIKVNRKRTEQKYILQEGDEI